MSNTSADDVKEVAASATVVTLAAENPKRESLSIYNFSTSAMRVKHGAGASSTGPVTVVVEPKGLYELPRKSSGYVYDGIVTGIWPSTDGGAYVTEG